MENTGKRKIRKIPYKSLLLIFFGSLITGFSNSCFLIPFDIVKGGMTSIAMILSKVCLPLFNMETTDFFLAGLNVLCWIVAFFFVGKDFAFKSLLGTILYPLFVMLFTRIGMVNRIGLYSFFETGDETAKLILLGLAGGVLNGIGLALCFMGEGSTGGSDVLSVLLVKFTNIRQGLASLAIDSVIILIGFAAYQDWGKLLVGVLTAAISAEALKLLYGRVETIYVINIISDAKEKIRSYVSDTLHTTCTFDTVEGGYSRTNKTKTNIILSYKDMRSLLLAMKGIDPQAMISVYEASQVQGGMFEPLRK